MIKLEKPTGILPTILYKDKNLLRRIIMMVFVFILVASLKPDLFLRSSNFISMAKQFPEYGIMAIGISLAMITGGIDLAVVGTANLSAIIAAKFLIATVPKGSPPGYTIGMILTAVLIGLASGIIAGSINGVFVSKIGIPAILATLGTQQLFTGIAIVLTEGKPMSGMPALYSRYGNKNIFGFLPVPLIIYIIIAVAIGILLLKTRFGMQLYMLGTNENAARFTGLNNTWIIIRTYALSGLLSAFAGLIMMARANSAKADYGAAYTLQCVLIAVLGGVNPNGGFGTVQGVTVAVLILQFLSSGLNMFENISNFYRDLIWGAVLILVLIFDYVINKREQKILLKQ
ncbi:MAG: ABC transporter permease [Acetivibrionales bacterium]|jgi:simple sugar transport system permease protein